MGECAQPDVPRRFRHAPESSIFATVTTSAFLKLYALTAPILFAIDLAWLGLVAKDFYRTRLGDLMRPDPRWGAAILFYLLYVAALLIFAVIPALERASLSRAAALGAGLGFICYSTYDLTNLALAKGFSTSVAVVDIAWGTMLGAAISAVAFKLAGLVL
jgi:uncharacterized membrane protein